MAAPAAATPAPTKKSRKTSAPKTKVAPLHPPYSEMIKDAIVSLKERNGSSPQAIAKFIQEKYKSLPANYKKLLSTQLKKQAAAGKLVKVKASFKLPPKNAPAAADSSAAVKPKAAAKPKTAAKKAPAKKPKATVKPKATASKAKPSAKTKVAAPKAKPAAKPKAAAKAKTPTKPAAKSAKTSTRATPARAAASKKIPVKKTPAKKAATPKKAAAATKRGRK